MPHENCSAPQKASFALHSRNLPYWMTIASQERGIRTFPLGMSNPRITEYNLGTNIEGHDDKSPWCSTFINWSLARCGIEGTNSAVARSWLDWGRPLQVPIFGCITILTREKVTGWKGHVGFFVGFQGDLVNLLGGNQLDEVREHLYPTASILGYRWPTSVPVSS